MFQFLASPDSSQTYTLQVRQTYSDGSVVDWSGAETSDTPAPVVEAKSSLGGGGQLDGDWIALVLGAVAIVIASSRSSAAVEAAEGRASSHETRGAHRGGRGSGARPPRRRVGARRPPPHGPGREQGAELGAERGHADLLRADRAALRHRLGHRRGRAPGHGRLAAPAPANPNTLVVPLKKIPEGWYLVYWRVISVDGHPVRGAFTFAVGPNAGPAPQFVIPSISETAATPALVILRWIVFLIADGRRRPVRPADR